MNELSDEYFKMDGFLLFMHYENISIVKVLFGNKLFNEGVQPHQFIKIIM